MHQQSQHREPQVFLNGQMLPASQAHLTVYDAGVVLGATVTELVRTFRKELFRLDDHLRRLSQSLHFVGFDIGMSMEELGRTVRQLVAHNAALLGPEDELGVVIFVTAGEYPTYAGGAAGSVRTTPTLCAHTFPLPFELWAEKLLAGIHLVTPSIRHVPPQCYDPKMKCRSRMHYYLADQQARLVDRDAAALLLDLEGNVTETGAANFLIVEDGAIISPSLRNTLPGVSRATVIELAAKLGIPFAVRDFQVFDAVNAEEAFLASTPYCLMSVTKINGTRVGTGKPGAIYNQLVKAWSELVGLDIVQQVIDGARRRTAKP
ncbi:MAG TPA: aminotransferase class IV [Planctomycetaceae bacterium]|jgi:branched-subunit amino acid aminotransferase/4-amino-4-deoxychorismate lyase|nr:aminotransferase class IV [Planctomycetaceae bacterium]